MSAALRMISSDPAHKLLERVGVPFDPVVFALALDELGGEDAQRWAGFPLLMRRDGRAQVEWSAELRSVPDLGKMPAKLRSAIGDGRRKVFTLDFEATRWRRFVAMSGDELLRVDASVGDVDRQLAEIAPPEVSEGALRQLLRGEPCAVANVAALFGEGGRYEVAGAWLADGGPLKLDAAIVRAVGEAVPTLGGLAHVEVFAVVGATVLGLAPVNAVKGLAETIGEGCPVVRTGWSWGRAGEDEARPDWWSLRGRPAWADQGVRAVKGAAEACVGEHRHGVIFALKIASLDRPADVAAEKKLAAPKDRAQVDAVIGPAREHLRAVKAREIEVEPELEVERELVTADSGKPRSCEANLLTILERDSRWAGLKCSVLGPTVTLHGEALDDLPLAKQAVQFVSKVYGLDYSMTTAKLAIAAVALSPERRYNPVEDYLRGLVWDEVSRLHLIPSQVLGAQGTVLEQTYIRRFLIGAVARALRPGCKMDTALVLTGKQGAKKSTFFKTLFGEWFGDSPIPIGNKDAFIQMAASWGYEAQELESTRKKEVEAVRGFMSSGCDTYRAPYASTAKPHRRHSVLCGSTNDDVFLTDDAGSRRFWPIAVADHLDIVWLAENRDQIWAEAVAFYEGGEQWHLTPEEEDGRVEDAVRFTEGDVWAEPIARALATATGWVTINDVLDELKIELGRRGMVEARRAGKVLKALGWERADVPVADQKAHGLPKHAYRRVVK